MAPIPEQHPKAEGSDTALIVILLVVMAFFLIRNLRKFSQEGLKVSRPKKGKDHASDEEESEEEEEEEEEDEPYDSQYDEDDKRK